MQYPRLLPFLLALLGLAACGEDQSPTAPRPPAGPSGPAFSHTAGHKMVNSLADPGDGTCNATQCTLREAINDPGSTEISFAPGLTGTITLARSGLGGGTLVIEKALTITGPSAGIVIRRRSTDPAFRIFRIGSGVSVRLTNLTIRNGKTDLSGGGIRNFGTLALTHCVVAGNSATFRGGGISNHRTLTLTNSRVSGNSAVEGGGIYSCGDCPLTVTSSTVEGNSGSGITTLGRLALTNTNVARNSGGGIATNRGRSTITHARIVGNSGVGIFAIGEENTVTLTHSTVEGNSGVGIANRDGSTFTISNSTVADNSGGGISNEALDEGRVPVALTLINSTVSGNGSSATSGGGIFNRSRSLDEAPATLTLVNSTVVRNSATQEGGGIDIFHLSAGTLTLVNSLVAQNHAPTGPDVFRVEGTSVLARFSLIGDGSGSGITNTDGNQVGNVSPNSSPIDPRLGPLADNGGPTRTHALLLGSPAIDAASTPDCPTTDQRGVLRPQGAACDIGSYERE
jgi:CSLREA domain-containing protein